MTIQSDIQALNLDATVEMFILDLSPITGVGTDVYRFYPGTNQNDQPLVWQGLTYSPYPVKVEGYEKRVNGTLPRPTLTASNVSGLLSALVMAYDDIVGAKITRVRTLLKYLDGVNFPAQRNLLKRTENNFGTGWSTTGASVTPQGVTPGGNAMTAIKETAVSNNHFGYQSVSFVAGTQYTVSAVFGELPGSLKRYASIFGLSSVFGVNTYAVLDTATGQLTAKANCTAKVEKISDNRYRLQMTATATATLSASLRFQISASATLPGSYLGDTSSGILVGETQLESNAEGLATKYQPVVGASYVANLTADSGQEFPRDVHYVDRKVSEDHLTVSWELASSIDLQGFMLPNRSITVNYCPFKYRGNDGCGYTGSNYFDVSDAPVSDPALDVCSKSVNGCKVRFGTGRLSFGGFPGAKVYKV